MISPNENSQVSRTELMEMNIAVLDCHRLELIAWFLHPRQAVAVLPALARAVGGPVFLYSTDESPLFLTKADLPAKARFEFAYVSRDDVKGHHGVVCQP